MKTFCTILRFVSVTIQKIKKKDSSSYARKLLKLKFMSVFTVVIGLCFGPKTIGELKNVSAIHYCSFGEKSVLRQALHKLHLTTYNGMYFTKVTYITPMIKYIDTLHISNRA